MRIVNVSFSRDGEYAVNQEFRFDAYVCGNCISAHQRPPERVSVVAESEHGRDLLDDMVIEPILDGSGRMVGKRVKFYLSGRIGRDGEEVRISLRADGSTERIPVYIYPD